MDCYISLFDPPLESASKRRKKEWVVKNLVKSVILTLQKLYFEDLKIGCIVSF